MVSKVPTTMLEGAPEEAGGLVPVGGVVPYAGATAPAGWAFCFGQLLLRSANASLFAAIGTAFGAGDGTTTFQVPDLRGRVPLGRDNMGGAPANRVTVGVSGVAGSSLGAGGGDQRLHAHAHSTTVTDPGHQHALSTGGPGLGGVAGEGSSSSVAQTGAGTTDISVTVNTAGAGDAQNVQPVQVLNYIIRVV